MSLPHWQKIEPPIYIYGSKGGGWAHWIIDYGLENSLYWVIVNDLGQVWRLPNEQVRFGKNFSMERPSPESPI